MESNWWSCRFDFQISCLRLTTSFFAMFICFSDFILIVVSKLLHSCGSIRFLFISISIDKSLWSRSCGSSSSCIASDMNKHFLFAQGYARDTYASFCNNDGRAVQSKGSHGGSEKLGAQELDNQVRQVFPRRWESRSAKGLYVEETWLWWWLSETGSSRTWQPNQASLCNEDGQQFSQMILCWRGGSSSGSVKLGAPELANSIRQVFAMCIEDGRAVQPKDYICWRNMAVVAQELDNQIRQVFAFGEQFCGGSVKLGVQELDNQRLAFRWDRFSHRP